MCESAGDSTNDKYAVKSVEASSPGSKRVVTIIRHDCHQQARQFEGPIRAGRQVETRLKPADCCTLVARNCCMVNW
jgi:hypothetical protein